MASDSTAFGGDCSPMANPSLTQLPTVPHSLQLSVNTWFQASRFYLHVNLVLWIPWGRDESNIWWVAGDWTLTFVHCYLNTKRSEAERRRRVMADGFSFNLVKTLRVQQVGICYLSQLVFRLVQLFGLCIICCVLCFLFDSQDRLVDVDDPCSENTAV